MKSVRLSISCVLLIGVVAGESRARDGQSTSQRRQAPNNVQCKDKTTFTVNATQLTGKPFSFKCPKGPIVEAEAVGIKGRCRGHSPHLMMSTRGCHWNQTCTILYRGMTIVKPTDGKESSLSSECFGVAPEKVEIKYLCLKKNVLVQDVLGTGNKTLKQKTGILRSHKLYPWSYRSGLEVGHVKLHQPRKSGLSNLWITVHKYDILYSDILFLVWTLDPRATPRSRLIMVNDTTFSVDNIQEASLVFHVDYDTKLTSSTANDNGFILCFEWLQGIAKPRQNSACTQVFQPGKCTAGGDKTNPGKSG